MKRIFFAAVASSAFAFASVGVAVGHSGENQRAEPHHRAHHANSHKRHHRHAQLLRFGSAAASGTSGSTTAPTTPVGQSEDTAGTVASFTSGVLTIKLTDGSLVSGMVNEGTSIECRSAAPSATAADNGAGRGDDGSDNRGSGENSGPAVGHHDDEGGDDDAGDEAEHCTSAMLVSGAVVREAELSVSGAGSVWQKVELGQ